MAVPRVNVRISWAAHCIIEMKIIRGEIITANYNVIKELMLYLSGSMSQMKISHNQSTTAAV